MAGDSKIGPQVAGVMRPAAMRKIGAGSASAARAAAVTSPVSEAEPAGQLISLTRAIAEDGPPVDTARVANLRAAIATGSYRVDADATARAMLAFHRGSPAC
ncbi:flagellar biosynthesis anti-sigma factor FlgM [Sphingopyxis flava]|uniref:Negative regulator of flagellin synthesis n=1 Tax=Sphingopyxis flava TaxID=1507287 RepID=A0A1T5B422_9SPHN|nr:flagellar biosynthesis anti-sigma factor FlgM [Sphingopyxis flava]SKB41992.1 anti-sigma-28 factor, FlgM family [Sphingopyxis flava]